MEPAYYCGDQSEDEAVEPISVHDFSASDRLRANMMVKPEFGLAQPDGAA